VSRIAKFRWTLAAIASAVALWGCQAKVLAPTPADQLRRQNTELAAKVESLERQLSEARTALLESEARRVAVTESGDAAGPQGASDATKLSSEALQATPHLAGIAISGSSHTDRPIRGEGCVARIYVVPVDGLGRFMQVVGTARVTLYWSPPGCEAQVLSCHEVGPMPLRDAYRSGFGGTHYTIEWPIGLDAASPEMDSAGGSKSAWTCGSAVEVKVEFADALSGRVFTARRSLAGIVPPGGGRQ
jgi:hypothetical protein